MVTTNIDINLLKPNPNNPRKDLGDLTELTESIRQNGILQPLLVMIDDEKMESYTVLIGHRRLAAAKLAGLEEVPCNINMTRPVKAEQMGIMLQENMNRSSLTAKEEADGFQYMLDLGETVRTVSAKTGFSETTVRRRLKVAELDAGAIKKAESGFNLQISDYDKLGQLADPKARDKVLNDSADRQQFEYNIKQAVRQQQIDDITKKWSKAAKDLSIPKGSGAVHSYNPNYQTVCYFPATEEGIKQFENDKFEYGYDPMEWEEKCCWCYEYCNFFIMKKRQEEKKPGKEQKSEAEQLAEVQKRQDIAQLKADVKAFKERIAECLAMIARGELKTELTEEYLREEVWRLMIEAESFPSYGSMAYALVGCTAEAIPTDARKEAKEKGEKLDALHQMFAVLAGEARDRWRWLIPYRSSQGDKISKEDEGIEKMCRVLQLIQTYGFTINKVEESIITGTHRGFAYADTSN